jgi:hypothetical protein
VEAAFQRQLARQGKANAALTTKEIDAFCQPDTAGEGLLKQAIGRLNLSARGYHRVLKVARTIADLPGIGAASDCRGDSIPAFHAGVGSRGTSPVARFHCCWQTPDPHFRPAFGYHPQFLLSFNHEGGVNPHALHPYRNRFPGSR